MSGDDASSDDENGEKGLPPLVLKNENGRFRIAGMPSTPTIDVLGQALKHNKIIQNALDKISLSRVKPPSNPVLTSLVEKLGHQERALRAMKESAPLSEINRTLDDNLVSASQVRIPDFALPPNPVHETNDRLHRIERQFEKIQDVAANGAEIATGLQSYAAEFLQKFELAATDNNQSAKRAIWLGGIAVLIALLVPVLQIAYAEFWRAPNDAATTQAIILDMKAELNALREAQSKPAERFTSETVDQLPAPLLPDQPSSIQAPIPVPIPKPELNYDRR